MILPYAAGLDMKRPETPTMRDWQVKAMAKTIQKKIKDIDQAFKEIDTDGSGLLSHAEFIQALRKIGLSKIGDNESASMMHKYKEKDNETGQMRYSEFKACIEEYLRLPSDINSLQPKETSSAALQLAEKTIAAKFAGKTLAEVEAFFVPFDEYKNGEISYDSFKRGLAAAGIVLSKAQFDSIAYKLDAMDDGVIAYKDFALIVLGGKKEEEKPAIGAFPGWIANGVRTIMDLVTGKPYQIDTACNHACAKLGLSINEGKLCYALLGRRDEFKAACVAMDTEGAGSIEKAKMGFLLDKFNAPNSDEIMSTLLQKYDRPRVGRVNYIEFDRWLGPLVAVSDNNLKRLNLERMPPSEHAMLKAGVERAQRAAGGGGGGAGAGVGSGAGAATGATGGGVPKHGRARDDSDAVSVATGQLDMSNAYRKMVRVLGKNWPRVMEDLKRKAARESALHGAGSGAGAKGGLVPAAVLRDAFADAGVALTGKECRGLSHHYSGKGPVATRTSDGVVDVDLLGEIFQGKGKGVPGAVKGGRSSSVPPRR